MEIWKGGRLEWRTPDAGPRDGAQYIGIADFSNAFAKGGRSPTRGENGNSTTGRDSGTIRPLPEPHRNMIPSACPNCGAKFHLKDEYAGKQARCPNCQNVFRVGDAPPAIVFEAGSDESASVPAGIGTENVRPPIEAVGSGGFSAGGNFLSGIGKSGPGYAPSPNAESRSGEERGAFAEHAYGIKQKKISFVTERYFVRDKDNRDVWYAVREIKIFKSLMAVLAGVVVYALVSIIAGIAGAAIADAAEAVGSGGSAVPEISSGSGSPVRHAPRRAVRRNSGSGTMAGSGTESGTGGQENVPPPLSDALVEAGYKPGDTGGSPDPALSGSSATERASPAAGTGTSSGSGKPSNEGGKTQKRPKELEDALKALKENPKTSGSGTVGTDSEKEDAGGGLLSAVLGILAVLAGSATTMALFPKRHIRFYRDDGFDSSTPPEANVIQMSRFEFPKMRYRMEDRDGTLLATFEKNVLTNVFRRKWRITLADGRNFLVKEDSIILSLLRRFLPFGNFIRTNFVFFDLQADPDQTRNIGIFKRKFEIFDNYLLDLSNDPAFGLPRKVAIGMSILLDTGERR